MRPRGNGRPRDPRRAGEHAAAGRIREACPGLGAQGSVGGAAALAPRAGRPLHPAAGAVPGVGSRPAEGAGAPSHRSPPGRPPRGRASPQSSTARPGTARSERADLSAGLRTPPAPGRPCARFRRPLGLPPPGRRRFPPASERRAPASGSLPAVGGPRGPGARALGALLAGHSGGRRPAGDGRPGGAEGRRGAPRAAPSAGGRGDPRGRLQPRSAAPRALPGARRFLLRLRGAGALPRQHALVSGPAAPRPRPGRRPCPRLGPPPAAAAFSGRLHAAVPRGRLQGLGDAQLSRRRQAGRTPAAGLSSRRRCGGHLGLEAAGPALTRGASPACAGRAPRAVPSASQPDEP